MLETLIPIGASIIGGLFGASGQEKTNTQNLKIAREQMDFQERMSNTAYPRAVQGMKDAGLNPMLAYSQGGASTPVGSMPQVQNAAAVGVNSAAATGSMISSIQSVLQSKAATDKLAAEAKLIESQTPGNIKALDLSNLSGEEQVRILRQELSKRQRENELGRETFSADAARRKAESLEAGYSATLRGKEIPRAEADEAFYKGLGENAPYLRMLLDLARGLSSAYGAVKPAPGRTVNIYRR